MQKKIKITIFSILTVLMLIRNTILISQEISSLLCLFFMALLIIINLFNIKEHINKKFIFSNFIILLFLLIHFFIIILFKPSIDNISVYFNEFVYLAIIYMLGSNSDNDLKLIIKVIIISNLAINIISMATSFLSYFDILNLNSYVQYKNLIGIYTNPNSMGINTCIITMMYFTYFFDKKSINSYLFIIFNFLIVYFSGCRTALLIVPFYVMFYFLFKNFSKYRKQMLIFICCSMFAILGTYYSYMLCNKDNEYLNKYETKIDSFLTYRYKLSKYSILSLHDKYLIGIPNKDIASLRFKEIPQTITREMEYSEIALVSSNGNNHNSYTQILVNQGLIILILFLLIICIGLFRVNSLNIPIILVILIISFFENDLLISKNFIMLILMALLANKRRIDNEKN